MSIAILQKVNVRRHCDTLNAVWNVHMTQKHADTKETNGCRSTESTLRASTASMLIGE